ncbi:myosuppressin receptor activity protein [Homalodisca vitripennis]|nr:myosuppressin receptor activity protein [Homalodisca vitripennis]
MGHQHKRDNKLMGLKHLHAGYGYGSLLVCVFGSVANLLNIAALSRQEMSSRTNAILTGLAVADLLVLLEYILFACHMYLPQRPKRERFSYGWALFVLLHAQWHIRNIALLDVDRSIVQTNLTLVSNMTFYVVDLSEMGKTNDNVLMGINFWVYNGVIKTNSPESQPYICVENKKLIGGSRKMTRLVKKERQTDNTTRIFW